jgi:hypothetical protein
MPSTVIRSFDYNADTRKLAVIFRSGRQYLYLDVPPDVYEGLKISREKGVFLNTHIRNQYAYVRGDSSGLPANP